jgi:hypothetical protein
MSIFFNPLLQIGDLVEISYPETGLYSSEDSTIPTGFSAGKYIVLDLNHDWVDGPATKILCRSIYVD